MRPQKVKGQEEEPYLLFDMISEKKLKDISISSSAAFFDQICKSIPQLPIQHESFRIIKKLVNFYGVCILPFLKAFYDKIAHQHLDLFDDSLKYIASLVRNRIDGRKISEISFIFNFGQSQELVKKKIQDSDEKEFLSLIEKLSMLSHDSHLNEYSEFIKNLQEKYRDQEIKLILISKLASCQTEKDVYEGPEKFEKQEKSFILDEKSQTQKKQLDLKEDVPLCCRRYFLKHQAVTQAQGIRYSCVEYRFPFNGKEKMALKQIICSFLNAEGGMIFIGLKKEKDKQKKVKGLIYSEAQKEELLVTMRKIAQVIEPDIITYKMYNVSFIPIKQTSTGSYLPGLYIVRIKVRYGKRDQIYSYQDGSQDRFMFRIDNQIYEKQGRPLMKAIQNRVKNPLPIPEPIHEGFCQNPELGSLLHSQNKTSISPFSKQKQKKLFVSPPIRRNSSAKKLEKTDNSQVLLAQQVPVVKKQKEFYFLLIGLNEQRLETLLEKKPILKNKASISKIGVNSKKLLVTCLSSEVDIFRKIFEKLVTKYPTKQYFQFKKYIHIEQNKAFSKQELKKLYNLSWQERSQNIMKFSSQKEKLLAFNFFLENNCIPSFTDAI